MGGDGSDGEAGLILIVEVFYPAGKVLRIAQKVFI